MSLIVIKIVTYKYKFCVDFENQFDDFQYKSTSEIYIISISFKDCVTDTGYCYL